MKWVEMEKNSRKTPSRIVVIGGGLAGLTAAHRLNELKLDRELSLEVTVLEAGPRLGGIIGTERIGDYLVDKGADSFITNKPGAVSLCRRLGIEDRLMPTDARFRGALVLHDGRPVPVPEGFQLLSPTAIWPVITTPLFSIWGKLRLLMEWFVPKKNPAELGSIDESVADFTRRRFGREALERLIQPLVGGIYTSDPEKLSLAATMPRFLEMEQEYGSLIRASLFPKKSPNESQAETSSAPIPLQADSSGGARYGLFAGLKGGMNDLVEALDRNVTSLCQVKLNCSVVSVVQNTLTVESASPGYTVTLADGKEERFDAVIVAATAAKTADILEPLDAPLSQELRGIKYASSALVVTGHQLSDISHPLNAFGLVIPHIERRRILAVSFSSRKFTNRAPAGRVLLRTFVGGALQPEFFSQTDEQMIATVREELAEIFGVRGEPDFVRVYKYSNAMPQYHVGHLDRVARIEALTRQHSRLALAGISFRGVGIPDVIACGERAAEEILADQ